jgi:hypothetical protein
MNETNDKTMATPSEVAPTEPAKENFTRDQIINAIKHMVYIGGMTGDAIKAELAKDLEGDPLIFAESQVDKILDGRDHIDRKTLRLNRVKNGITFSKGLKNHLKELNQKSHGIE